MKAVLKFSIAAIVCAAAASPAAFGQMGGQRTYHPAPYYNAPPTDPTFHSGNPQVPLSNLSPKGRALFDLRQEGLRLRDADGGTLTPEHLAYLQAKLDAIQAGKY